MRALWYAFHVPTDSEFHIAVIPELVPSRTLGNERLIKPRVFPCLEVIYMGRPYTCPYCEVAGENVAKGFRLNKDGKVRLRRCKACGRRWTVRGSSAPAEETTMPAPVAGSPREGSGETDAPDEQKPDDPGNEGATEPHDSPPAEPAEESCRYVGEGKPEP